MDNGIGQIFITFLAGMLSVLSPCILPLMPGFVAWFAGLGLDEARTKKHRIKMLINSLWFSLGFTLTFLGFGLVAGGISFLLIENQVLLQQLGGVILIIFGILQTGLIKLKFTQKEYRLDRHKYHLPRHEYLRSLLIGVIFAFSWTPCYGPVIGGIFTMSAAAPTLWAGLLLFLVYSLGFTLPIILLSLVMDQISTLMARHKHLLRFSHLIAGILLILIGMLMLSNNFSAIVNWLDIIYTQNKLNFS
jgi:cytochrome c-type biogenesis protein